LRTFTDVRADFQHPPQTPTRRVSSLPFFPFPPLPEQERLSFTTGLDVVAGPRTFCLRTTSISLPLSCHIPYEALPPTLRPDPPSVGPPRDVLPFDQRFPFLPISSFFPLSAAVDGTESLASLSPFHCIRGVSWYLCNFQAHLVN